jgi:hypothetical protein
MQDLTLVGLTEDKTRLVLVSDSGEEFTLPVDARLRSALRGDHARLGQLEIQMESTLRPRDIQARIRSGESPETVAAAAQTTVDKIMGFAMPVLAERAHIADRAQRSSVRRKSGEGPTRLLGDAVAERLRGRNVDPDSVEWDAWRREDGRWTLVADYLSGESSRHAEFVYDAPGRYVIPEDDEAKWMVGEQTSRKGPQPRSGGNARRLSAVTAEDELPLGEDAIGLVSEPDPVDEEHTVDLSQTAAAVREQSSERPAPSEESAEPTESDEPSNDAAEQDGEADDDKPTKRAAKKTRGRASVPSWDEIMFGGGKSE